MTRIPVVGEVWTYKNDDRSTREILSVVPKGILVETERGIILGQEIAGFVACYNPPKPAPRYVYLNVYSDGSTGAIQKTALIADASQDDNNLPYFNRKRVSRLKIELKEGVFDD